ncbi:MAG: tyrosine--tRNA ligase, partial [Myxococcales bacterium]|nr:tyrosine--tRNA ligase [Myxococcales bacterium]
KSAERNLLSADQLRENIAGIQRQMRQFLDFQAADNPAVVVNNFDWMRKFSYLDFLRDVGKQFSVNTMLAKDSVKSRIDREGEGISYTEFSYMILQAYDFLHLHRSHDCTVQISGSDQYGNIVSGMDLIRRDAAASGREAESFAVTTPLLLKADGKKFGKSESGNIWLSSDRTSPYAFYQFWINASDADAGRFLRTFTLLGRDEIEAIEKQHVAAPHERCAQQRLAEEITGLIHGAEELARVQAATLALFGKGALQDLDATLLSDVFADVPHSTHQKTELEKDGVALADLLPKTSLAKSKREAREYLKNGAIAVNGQKAISEARLTERDLLHGETILIKRGKKLWHASIWR